MKKFWIGMFIAAGMLCLCACGKTEGTEAANAEMDQTVSHDVSTETTEEIAPEPEETVEESEKESMDTSAPEKEPALPEVKKACKKLMKELELYEYVAMLESQPYEVGQQKTIDLDSREITRAAGFAIPYNYEEEFVLEPLDSGEYIVADGETDDPICYGMELSRQDLNETARDLFGKDADTDRIYTDGNDLCDIIKLADGTGQIVRMSCDCETETDFEIRSGSIKKSKNRYVFTQKVYYGYWGNNDDKNSNYMIRCGIEREETSKYGFILSSMQIKRIDDESGWNRAEEIEEAFEPEEPSDSVEPFYGIWCYGVKSEAEAERGVEAMYEKGLDGRIFVTTDWSNLNPEKWYVVTAGVYDSKEDAQNALQNVKDSGYSNAYIKYTGDYIGD